mmetsp:Transcript_6312/g.11289  ORF Transcript_6312/g.11289 Transcript_6312/m.11289 type:complete len:292 (+) Transcript_6312:210-1085(+)
MPHPTIPTSDRPPIPEWAGHFWYCMRVGALQSGPYLNDSQRKDVRAFFMSLRTMLPCLKCQNHYRQLLVKYPITDDHTRNAHKMSAWVEDMKRYIEQTKLEEPAHGHSHSGHGGYGHSHGHGGHGHSHGHGGHGHSHGHGGGHSHHQQQQQQQQHYQQQQHGGSRRAGYGTSSRSMRREDSLPRITGGAGGGAGAGGRSPRYGGGGGRSPRYEQQAKASGGYGIRRGRVVSEQRVRRNDDDIWKREYQRVKADKKRRAEEIRMRSRADKAAANQRRRKHPGCCHGEFNVET